MVMDLIRESLSVSTGTFAVITGENSYMVRDAFDNWLVTAQPALEARSAADVIRLAWPLYLAAHGCTAAPYVLKRDGETVGAFERDTAVLGYFQTNHCYTAWHGLKNEGYTLYYLGVDITALYLSGGYRETDKRRGYFASRTDVPRVLGKS